jgi:RecA DNA recombination protein
MNAALKKEVESVLSGRFGSVFERHERPAAKLLPTGVAEIDRFLHGLPRGAISEIHGSLSSGRTSLLLSALAQATAQEEICAVVDCSDTFDPLSAATGGIDCERLLWVRCSQKLERAFKAVDLLLHGGGFGVIALVLSDVPAKAVRRIISSWWFRFRRAIENTPTVLMVITPAACVRSCAALVLELKKETELWPSSLSLVSENVNSALTEQATSHLSLVTPIPEPFASLSLSHAHFLQGLSLQVNRERPLEWSDRIIGFQARSALTMFGDIR